MMRALWALLCVAAAAAEDDGASPAPVTAAPAKASVGTGDGAALVLAGGDFILLKRDLLAAFGGITVDLGYTGGRDEHPTYEKVAYPKRGGLEHVLAVRVPLGQPKQPGATKPDLESLLGWFLYHEFKELAAREPFGGPSSVHSPGHANTIFVDGREQVGIVQRMLKARGAQRPETAQIAVRRLKEFYPAEAGIADIARRVDEARRVDTEGYFVQRAEHNGVVLAAGDFIELRDYLKAKLPGLHKAELGYCFGHDRNPNYEAVLSGRAGHALAVHIPDGQVNTTELFLALFAEYPPFAETTHKHVPAAHRKGIVVYSHDHDEALRAAFAVHFAKRPPVFQVSHRLHFYPAEPDVVHVVEEAHVRVAKAKEAFEQRRAAAAAENRTDAGPGHHENLNFDALREGGYAEAGAARNTTHERVRRALGDYIFGGKKKKEKSGGEEDKAKPDHFVGFKVGDERADFLKKKFAETDLAAKKKKKPKKRAQDSADDEGDREAGQGLSVKKKKTMSKKEVKEALKKLMQEKEAAKEEADYFDDERPRKKKKLQHDSDDEEDPTERLARSAANKRAGKKKKKKLQEDDEDDEDAHLSEAAARRKHMNEKKRRDADAEYRSAKSAEKEAKKAPAKQRKRMRTLKEDDEFDEVEENVVKNVKKSAEAAKTSEGAREGGKKKKGLEGGEDAQAVKEVKGDDVQEGAHVAKTVRENKEEGAVGAQEGGANEDDEGKDAKVAKKKVNDEEVDEDAMNVKGTQKAKGGDNEDDEDAQDPKKNAGKDRDDDDDDNAGAQKKPARG